MIYTFQIIFLCSQDNHKLDFEKLCKSVQAECGIENI